jgi:hypothetical protein
MAFRASSIVTSDAYANIKRQANASKAYLQQKRQEMTAATVSASVPFAVIQHFAAVLPLLATWAATAGLAAYAQAQENDPAYDVSAEYVAMRNAMQSARDQLIATFPKDGSGFLLYQTMNADGTVALRTFTAAQLAPTVALLDSVIATIA